MIAKIAAHLKSDFLVAPRSSREAEFGVVHYAGLVRYQVDGFLEKNRDWMPPEVAALMRTSELALVRALFNQSGTFFVKFRSQIGPVNISKKNTKNKIKSYTLNIKI